MRPVAELRVPPVYVLVDADRLGAGGVVPAVEAAVAAGVGWVQLRAKGVGDRRYLELAREVRRTARSFGSSEWVNDRADVAALAGVQGLHLGQGDLPPSVARRVVGEAVWIGQSTHDRDQVAAAAEDPAVDVIAVGPVFATASKSDAEPVVGLDLVRWARRRTGKPIVAIGGIDAGRVGEVLTAGADCVAVLGAACRGDVGENCRRLLAAAEGVAG